MLASPALANVICNPRSDFVEHLKEKYDEQPLYFGLNNDGRVVEVFGTPDGKTWTMIITDTRSLSCVVTSGEAWQKTAPTAPSGPDSFVPRYPGKPRVGLPKMPQAGPPKMPRVGLPV